MIKTVFFVAIIALMTLVGADSFAAELKELVVKSSVQCEMCDKTLQKGLKKINGIEKIVVDIEKKEITVKYNPETVTPEKIKSAITKLGYDADDLKAEQRAYVKLSNCCKKPEDRK